MVAFSNTSVDDRQEKVIGFLLDAAKKNLEEDGELLPILFLDVFIDDVSKAMLIGLDQFGPTTDDKCKTLYNLGLAIRSKDVFTVDQIRATYFVADSYTRSAMSKEELDNRKPTDSFADDPKAKEAIVVSVTTNGKDIRPIVIPYTREIRMEGTKFHFADEAEDPFKKMGVGDVESPLMEALYDGLNNIKEW